MNPEPSISKKNTHVLWIAATIVFLAALLAANYAGYAVAAGLAKTGASTCFIMVAVTCGAFASRYGKLIFAGLVLSWFGDVFLIGQAEVLFLAGLVSFLLGHVAYACAFVAHGIRRRWAGVSLVALLPVVFFVLRWLLPHVEGEMKGPVLAYIFVITLMVVFSWGARGKGAHHSIPIGAMLFFLSDIAVSRNRFVVPESMDWLWGLPLYYAGQLFLAYSVATIRAVLGGQTTERPSDQNPV